jgi:hypothetical protein
MDGLPPSHEDEPAPQGADASELHNPSVDADAARAGVCAQLHLATGAMCTKRRGHTGSCEFTPPDEADAAVARNKAAEQW